MIAILSSAKTLDFTTPWRSSSVTQPECLDEAKALLRLIRPLQAAALGKLLGVSPKLAAFNAERLGKMAFPFTPANAKPAILAYQGDVFRGMRSGAFSPEDLAFAQGSLRILSGLFGVLRPLDLIQPYRLEMATPLSGPGWKDLKTYWSDRVTKLINQDAGKNGKVIINLASQEYSSVLNPRLLTVPVLTLAFKQERKGKVEMIPILAKRARGLMARFMVTQRAVKPETLKAFQEDGYRFSPQSSNDSEWVFVRRAP